MSSNGNLSHLTDEESSIIMEVLQKDVHLRQLEMKRLRETHEELIKIRHRVVLLKESPNWNDAYCVICLQRFGLIFHRKRKCYKCKSNVCSYCCRPRKQSNYWECTVCFQEKTYEILRNQWLGCYQIIETSTKNKSTHNTTLAGLYVGSDGYNTTSSEIVGDKLLETVCQWSSLPQLTPLNNIQNKQTNKFLTACHNENNLSKMFNDFKNNESEQSMLEVEDGCFNDFYENKKFNSLKDFHCEESETNRESVPRTKLLRHCQAIVNKEPIVSIDDYDELADNKEEFMSEQFIIDRIHNPVSMFPYLNADSPSERHINTELWILNSDDRIQLSQLGFDVDDDATNLKKLNNWTFQKKLQEPNKQDVSQVNWDGSISNQIFNPRRSWISKRYCGSKIGVTNSDDNRRIFDANKVSTITQHEKCIAENLCNTRLSDLQDTRDVDTLTNKKSIFTDNYNLDKRCSTKRRLRLIHDFIPAKNGDPAFIVAPQSVCILEGEPITLSCRVSGTGAVERSEIEELMNSDDIEISNDINEHRIVIYNSNRDMAGQYLCIALNKTGKAIQYFVVTVKNNRREMKKPTFLRGISDVEVMEGQSVKFRVKINGFPAPRIYWYKDGQTVKNSKSCKTERCGNRDYILVIKHISVDDDAEYTVRARNIAGEETMSAQIIVNQISD